MRKKVSIPHSLSLVLFLSHFVSVSDFGCAFACVSRFLAHTNTHTLTRTLFLSPGRFSVSYLLESLYLAMMTKLSAF